ncbi:hypothetical protein Lalb_Chr00c21g0405971 (mitochondrion) [Lupinus albus]|uniref:Uncharacterized protein n=1 Tax=Lupinus albus TaxID=3870 RepID=A0A6A4NCJ8_LUPAL|nr:hypothetical protein Lalb_Chr00c21g0405971 [Lupinus albus]
MIFDNKGEAREEPSLYLFLTRSPFMGREKLQLVFSRRDFFLLGVQKDKKEDTISTRLRVLAYFTFERMSYFYLIFHRTLLHSINLLILILPPLLHQQRGSIYYITIE